MTPSTRRILIVDDDPASSELVAYFLKSRGYRVAIAPDGDRALNVNMENDIELVILDVHMPNKDGIQVLAMIRERHGKQPIKVLALTGDESADVRASLESEGIDGFLTKPVHLQSLGEEVARLMAGHTNQHNDGLYRRSLDRRVRHEW